MKACKEIRARNLKRLHTEMDKDRGGGGAAHSPSGRNKPFAEASEYDERIVNRIFTHDRTVVENIVQVTLLLLWKCVSLAPLIIQLQMY